MNLDRFCGGIFDTNGYVIGLPGGRMLVDAPDGIAQWLASRDLKVDLLFLTHGHFDHVVDAARVKREHGCPVACHPDGKALLEDRNLYRAFGLELEIEPVAVDCWLEEGKESFLGRDYQVLHVPGHCPGHVCLFDPSLRVLFGGDVLFAGGIGRTDLPGGDYDLLMRGIVHKVLPLGDDVKVYPGHGPATTIGWERQRNPYLDFQPQN